MDWLQMQFDPEIWLQNPRKLNHSYCNILQCQVTHFLLSQKLH